MKKPLCPAYISQEVCLFLGKNIPGNRLKEERTSCQCDANTPFQILYVVCLMCSYCYYKLTMLHENVFFCMSVVLFSCFLEIYGAGCTVFVFTIRLFCKSPYVHLYFVFVG